MYSLAFKTRTSLLAFKRHGSIRLALTMLTVKKYKTQPYTYDETLTGEMMRGCDGAWIPMALGRGGLGAALRAAGTTSSCLILRAVALLQLYYSNARNRKTKSQSLRVAFVVARLCPFTSRQ